MNSPDNQNRSVDDAIGDAAVSAPATDVPPIVADPVSSTPAELRAQRQQTVRWWLKLVLQPTIFLALVVLLIVLLGVAQRLGTLAKSGGTGESEAESAEETPSRYVCPMQCVPAQSEPGRCPVCSMELVPATAGSGEMSMSIEIDPTARRVANIQTARVRKAPVRREVRAIGELTYDEGTLKTLAAYVDGRIEALYADYTGVVVNKGDRLALIYSPQLYSAQVEFLLAKKSRSGRLTTLKGVAESNRRLFEGARQRLIEFGMAPDQIDELEESQAANSRLHLVAPISGTVIEKQAVEGQYVKEGQPIYRLADLSTLWLMLKLFPDDAAAVRYGQKVTATVQSYPGREFPGRVVFVDPHVDPKTRTVDVRVVIPNSDGSLRVGDYAKAAVEVPIAGGDGERQQVYDPDLAGKWVSPRHPHIVRDEPGPCPLCGIELVPAEQYGFTADETKEAEALVVPRNAVLMAGDSSVVYVEEEEGRFELRRVVLGATVGKDVVILDGVKEDELVATRGNFLIDSQMQLAGNPSLIDPNRMQPAGDEELPEKVREALAELPDADRELAQKQKICPVSEELLGSMGTPIKVDVDGRAVFICCEGCRSPLLEEKEKYLARLEPDDGLSPEERKKIAEALAQLSPEDRELAEAQRDCPVADFPLGSMGVPIKVDVNGTPVFICCNGCRSSLLKDPEKYLKKIADSRAALPADSSNSDPDLPPIGDPILLEMDDEQPDEATDLPPIGTPQLVDPEDSSTDEATKLETNDTVPTGSNKEVL